jgi:uncharacterized repeat protein (TIGR03943 family)
VSITPRLARATALAVWASFFAALWFSGDRDRYLGSRTMWVIPFGAAVTALIAALLVLRPTSSKERLRRREVFGIAVVLLPVAVALAVPRAELGAFAAEQRAVASSVPARLLTHNRSSGRAVTYADIMAASDHPQDGPRPGTRVRLIGFVMRKPGTPEGMFQVVRFFITCCVADATVLYATVQPTRDPPARDAWIDLSGTLARRNGQLLVDAYSLQTIKPPTYPYLSASSGQAAPLPAVAGGTRAPNPTSVKRPPPYRPPRPPRATSTLGPAAASSAGVRIAIAKIEFAATETRVFVTATNATDKSLRIFPSNGDISGNTIAVSHGQQYTSVSGSAGKHLLLTTLAPGVSTSGILTFPHLDAHAPLRIVFDAMSADATVGRHGAVSIEVAYPSRSRSH